jgi:hypothetical protein
MKTREQADARSMELYPEVNDFRDDSSELAVIKKQHRLLREGFLQCWEEMQANKQTCGFCVEPKQEEEKPQPQERVDKLGTNTPDKSKTYISPSTEMIAAFVNDEWMQFHRSDTIQDNGLLTVKQAESICIGFYNDLIGHFESGLSTELFDGEMVFNKHLEKALK